MPDGGVSGSLMWLGVTDRVLGGLGVADAVWGLVSLLG